MARWFDPRQQAFADPPDKRPTSGSGKHVRHLIRRSDAYDEWRRAVTERDDNTCQDCGRQHGEMHAHHIVPMSEDLSVSLKVENGITLCDRCHDRRH